METHHTLTNSSSGLITPNQTSLEPQNLNETSPRAREARLVIRELADEVLIYDLETNKAHCLNQTAAIVWKNCDGQRTVAELRELMENKAGLPVGEEIVWQALDQLARFKFLSAPVHTPARFPVMSRRRLMRNLSVVGTVSIPLITSIVVPTPAMAASCNSSSGRNIGCPCTFSSECASGCCRNDECKPGVGNCD